MKKLIMTLLSMILLSTLNVQASENIVCTIGDGKAATEPKVISATINKNGTASIDQEIGDYRIMAFWIEQISKVRIGVVERVSATSASTLLSGDKQTGSLFTSKNGQSVDLSCSIQ